MKKIRSILIAVVLILMGTSVFAENDIDIMRDAQDEQFKYVVRGGDTLWDISAKKLKNPWNWPKIWEQNTDVIEDPHWIYPGEVLYIIPPEELLRRKLNELPVSRLEGPHQAEAAGPGMLEEVVWTGPKSLTYTMAASQGFITTQEEDHVASIISSLSTDRKFLAERDIVVTNLNSGMGVKVGDKYTVFRLSDKRMKHPMTRKKIGWKVTSLGVLKITEVTDEDCTAEIVESYEEILVGDRLVPFKEAKIDIDLYTLDENDPDINGYFLFSKRELDFNANEFIVYIDVGENQGVKEGLLFEVYKPGRIIKDKANKKKVKEPDVPLAVLVVLKTQKDTSTAYVYKGNIELKPGEYIRAIKK